MAGNDEGDGVKTMDDEEEANKIMVRKRS